MAATIFGLEVDTLVKLAAGIAVIFVPVFGYRYGRSQEIKAAEEKTRLDAANAQTVAKATQQNADTDVVRTLLDGGRDTLKALTEGAEAYQRIMEQMQRYALEIRDMQTAHQREISDIKLAHATEMSAININVRELTLKVEQLERDNANKERELAATHKMRETNADLQKQLYIATAQLEESKRMGDAILYLWKAASEKKGDDGLIDVAEQAIIRVLRHADDTTYWNTMAASAMPLGKPIGPDGSPVALAPQPEGGRYEAASEEMVGVAAQAVGAAIQSAATDGTSTGAYKTQEEP